MAAKRKVKRNYTYAVGKRKSAVARVRLFKGKGANTVNAIPVNEYFPGEVGRRKIEEPFVLTDTLGKYFVTVKVASGGKEGQLDAVINGIAKAFSSLDPEKFRASVKKVGLLTRDPRERERRKIGTGGKARRKRQSPKR